MGQSVESPVVRLTVNPVVCAADVNPSEAGVTLTWQAPGCSSCTIVRIRLAAETCPRRDVPELAAARTRNVPDPVFNPGSRSVRNVVPPTGTTAACHVHVEPVVTA